MQPFFWTTVILIVCAVLIWIAIYRAGRRHATSSSEPDTLLFSRFHRMINLGRTQANAPHHGSIRRIPPARTARVRRIPPANSPVQLQVAAPPLDVLCTRCRRPFSTSPAERDRRGVHRCARCKSYTHGDCYTAANSRCGGICQLG